MKKKYSSIIKTLIILINFWLIGVFIFLSYNCIGNLLYLFFDYQIPDIFLIKYNEYYPLFDLLWVIPIDLDYSIKLFLIIYFIYAPFIITLSIIIIYAFKNLLFKIPNTIDHKLNNNQKEKLALIKKLVKIHFETKKFTPEILVYDNNEINSFIYVPLHSRNKVQIYISSTALAELTNEELVMLMLHEIGHIESNTFWKYIYTLKLTKLIPGLNSILILLFDIPEEERSADRWVIENYDSKSYDSILQRYSELLTKIQDHNIKVSYSNDLGGVSYDAIAFIDLFKKYVSKEKIKSYTSIKYINEFINIRINRFKYYYNLLFNNNSLLRVHPSAEDRVQALKDYYF